MSIKSKKREKKLKKARNIKNNNMPKVFRGMRIKAKMIK